MNLAWSEKGMDDINIDKIHFLKANWCDITVLESEGKYALIDTGFKGSFYTIDSFLKSQGVNKLEFIFLSHFHWTMGTPGAKL